MEINIHLNEVLNSQTATFFQIIPEEGPPVQYSIEIESEFSNNLFLIQTNSTYSGIPVWNETEQCFKAELAIIDNPAGSNSLIIYDHELGAIPFTCPDSELQLTFYYEGVPGSTIVVHQKDAEDDTRPTKNEIINQVLGRE